MFGHLDPWSAHRRGPGRDGLRQSGCGHRDRLRYGVGPCSRLVLPKGSLEKATLDLFEAADLRVRRDSDVAYRAEIVDPRIVEVRILRPQEIPSYVADGMFDLGITGRDWIEETASDVVSIGRLQYSKATSNPIQIVVAVAADAP